MEICVNYNIFSLVFYFYSLWAIFSFYNPVALVCGGYVMILSNKSDFILFEI